jgi:dynein heavy chain
MRAVCIARFALQRPGMVTLTWTSMNIDAYKYQVHSALRQLATTIGKVP